MDFFTCYQLQLNLGPCKCLDIYIKNTYCACISTCARQTYAPSHTNSHAFEKCVWHVNMGAQGINKYNSYGSYAKLNTQTCAHSHTQSVSTAAGYNVNCYHLLGRVNGNQMSSVILFRWLTHLNTHNNQRVMVISVAWLFIESSQFVQQTSAVDFLTVCVCVHLRPSLCFHSLSS